MARINRPLTPTPIFTAEGGKAANINAEQQLRRSVMACLLWENGFYENGQEITKRIAELIQNVNPAKVAQMAIEAREDMKLRHMPLFITREMARYDKYKTLVADTLARVIQRADELSEYVAMYWKEKKQPLSAQSKKGLAAAFTKFDEYQLAKYNRDNAIKLRDVLFLCHAKPQNKTQDILWKKLINDELAIPDTWEVAISACGKDNAKKRVEYERLLRNKTMGAMAVLRNLRNFQQCGVDENLVRSAILEMNAKRVLPFRFITAANYAPRMEDVLEQTMLKCMEGFDKLPGKTVLLVDISGSMWGQLSGKSDMRWIDAANGIAILAREICQQVSVYSFSNDIKVVPNRRGFALRDAIINSQPHGGTYLRGALEKINKLEKYDRIIVFTDEQTHDGICDPLPGAKGYVINVATNRNGVGYGKWHHIDGFSEATLNYISAYETEFGNAKF